MHRLFSGLFLKTNDETAWIFKRKSIFTFLPQISHNILLFSADLSVELCHWSCEGSLFSLHNHS